MLAPARVDSVQRLAIPEPAPRTVIPASTTLSSGSPLVPIPELGATVPVAPAVEPDDQDQPDAGSAAPVPGNATDPQEILLDLRFGRLAATTVQAFANGTVPLLPAFAFMQLAEIDVQRDSLGAIRAVLHPGERELYLSADSSFAEIDGRRIAIPDGGVRAEGDEIFVASTVLEELLELTIRTDWVALVTTVLDPGSLPVALRLQREARWARIQGFGSQASGVAPLLDLNNSAVGGAVLDWSVSNNMRTPEETFAYSAAFGARVFEGSLRLSSRSLGPVQLRQNRFDATYERVFRDLPWLTQLTVGDGLTTGPRLRAVRGVSLGNVPYFRGGEFATEALNGTVGPGWEVELRQSGRVVDLTRADEQGAFALDIPLRYGENAIQVVAFGPHGEVITTDRVMLAGSELIPEGAFEWGLSGGACRDDRCDATGNVDLRYGISDRITVRGGTEAFTRPGGSTVVQPYGQVSGLVLPSLQLSGETLVDGFMRGSAVFAPSTRFRVRGAYTSFSDDLDAPVLNDGLRRSTAEADVFFRPRRDDPRLFFRASLIQQELENTSLARAQASATFPVAGVQIEGGVRRVIDDPVGPVRTGDNFQFGAVFGNFRLGGRHRLFVRGEVEVLEAEIMNRLRGQVSYQINNGVRLNVAGTWQKFFGPSLSVTFNAFLGGFQSSVQMTATDEARSQLTQFSQGTVYWNEATENVSFAPGPGIQQGGLSGYVFLDQNGNGVRDRGEEGLEGVRLVVGGRPVVTDEQGRHRAWDLIPYQQVEVWADSASIMDPTLVPEQSRVRVDVPPASFGRVDVPITVSRQIAGSVLQVPDAGGAQGLALPYAGLELVNTESGEVRSFRAFSDGQFYEAGVRPGLYELRLSREYMISGRLIPQGAWPTVVVGTDNPFQVIGPIEIRVVRLPSQVDDGWIEGQSSAATTSDASARTRRDGASSGPRRSGGSGGGDESGPGVDESDQEPSPEPDSSEETPSTSPEVSESEDLTAGDRRSQANSGGIGGPK